MLTKLKVEDLALLDKLELDFESGLTVLTGETGAGKSVVVNALALALGGRAEKEQIRHGAKGAMVEATFDLSGLADLSAQGTVDTPADQTFTICRHIPRDGSTKIKVNGKSSSLSQLKQLTVRFGEILGQHSSQRLMDENYHLEFLDTFGGLQTMATEVADLFTDWKSAGDELRSIERRKTELASERELLLFQQDEIELAALKPGEESDLSTELKVLNSARELMNSASMIADILEGENHSVNELISHAEKELAKMSAVDRTLANRSEELTGIRYQLEEIRRTMEEYGSTISDDPNRIEEINLRLDEIYKLKKKYGGSEQAVLTTLNDIKRKLKNRPDVDSMINKLRTKTDRLLSAYYRKALKLSTQRKKTAQKLQKLVIEELLQLAIDNGGFLFEFSSEDDTHGLSPGEQTVKPLPSGLETGRILFSANPGEPLRPLVKIASGGEISRVLLALKSAQNKNEMIQNSMLVMDEVDSGIGGKTALAMGRKLKELSRSGQLIVITHLHQIARFADHHFAVSKRTDSDGRNLITVKKLNSTGIKAELDRMVSLPD